MQKQHAPARAFPLLALASLLLAGVPVLPFFAGTAQAAPAAFEENWDTGGVGWTHTGLRAGLDPTVSFSVPASLAIDAQTNGQTVKSERDLSAINPSLVGAPGYLVSFAFRNEHAASKSSSWFTMRFPDGGHVKLDPTHGEPHNRVRLYTNGTVTQPLTNAAGATWMYADDTWYEARIKVDLVNNKVRAEIWNPTTGARLANSTSLPIYASAKSIGLVSFEGTYNGNDPLATEAPWPMNYDNLQVRRAGPPGAPALSAASGPGVGQVSLSWQAHVDDGGMPVTHYTVFRGNASGTATTPIANVTTLSYTDSGLPNGTTRYYAVKAVNAVGAGAASNEAQATTFDRPSAPRTLIASPGAGVGEVRLTWQAPSFLGGRPVANYTIYRGATPENQSVVVVLGNLTSYVDAHLPNGTIFYYNVSASNLLGEGARSIGSAALPRPDHASAPTGLTVTPLRAWSGDGRSLTFSYGVTASQCAPDATCPVENEWRVYMDGSLGGPDGELLASGTNVHPGHAETLTYGVTAAISPAGDVGVHRLKVAVAPRLNGTWNVSTVEFRIDALEPGRLDGPTTPLLNASQTAQRHIVNVTSTFTVYQNRCGIHQVCPVDNEWRVLLRGGQLNALGAILANGTFSHPSHGTNETYTVRTSVLIPEVAGGDYQLIVAARHDPEAIWQEAATPLNVSPCAPAAQRHSVLAYNEAPPAGAFKYPTTYTYSIVGLTSSSPATLYNTCADPSQDDVYELGRGGVMLNGNHVGDVLTVTDRMGDAVSVIVGNDMDQSGVVGDSPLDCVQGPLWNRFTIACPAGPNGRLIVFIIPNPANPPEPEYPRWGGIPGGMPPLPPYSILWCRIDGSCPPPPPSQDDPNYSGGNEYYQSDSDGDNYGDAWATVRAGQDLVEILGRLIEDTDLDDLLNVDEFRWDTIAVSPKPEALPPRAVNARDFDNDNWLDGEEHEYWNNGDNDEDTTMTTIIVTLGQIPTDPDSTEDHWQNGVSDGDDFQTLRDPDVDGDGLLDGDEFKTWHTYPEFRDSDCALNVPCESPLNVWKIRAGSPGTGDGVNDREEKAFWAALSAAKGEDYLIKDFDFDQIPHDSDVKSNLLDPDSDGDEVLDGDEFLCRTPVARSVERPGSTTACTKAYFYDSDQDGLLDGQDVIVASANDPRWNLFANGITYVPHEGGRRYLGEFSQGTDPLDDDTDGDGTNDGDQAIGIHASLRSFTMVYEDNSPANQDLASIDETADAWLRAGTRQVTSTGAATVSSILGLANDPTGFINDTLTQIPLPIAASTVDSLVPTVYDTLECVDPLLSTTDPPVDNPVGAVLPRVDCLVGVVETFALNAVNDVQSTDVKMLPNATLATIQAVEGLILDNRIPFVAPILSTLPSNTSIIYDGDLGDMPTPPNPWDEDGPDGLPFHRRFWSESPYPRFLAANFEGPIFEAIASLDRMEPLGVEAIGTVDAGFYNIHVVFPNGTNFTIPNRPINSPRAIHLNDPSNADLVNPDLIVTAEYSAPLGSASPVPKLTVKRVSPLAVKVFVGAFMQIPNTDYIVALGNDARPAALKSDKGQPSTLELTLSTNALVRGLDPASRYEMTVGTPDLDWPTNLTAVYFKVDELNENKTRIPGERADLTAHFNVTPLAATATLVDEGSEGGLHFDWSGSSASTTTPGVTPGLMLGAMNEHAYTIGKVRIYADKLPSSISTDFVMSEEGLQVDHSSSAIVPRLAAYFEGWNNQTKAGGGVEILDLPASANFRVDTATSSATYSSSSALGLMEFLVYTKPKNQAEDACVKGANMYLAFVRNAKGSCATLSVGGLKSMTANYAGTGDVTFDMERNGEAGAFLLLIDDHATHFTGLVATITNWPADVKLKTTLTGTSMGFTSTLTKEIGWLNLTYTAQGKTLVLSVNDIPKSMSATFDASTGTVRADASLSTRLKDLLFQYSGGTKVGLADDDGTILVSRNGQFVAGAVRLRDFQYANVQVNSATGFSLNTDTTSPHRFSVRWDIGTSWVSATLPKLLSNIQVSYTKTPSGLTFHYEASDPIPNLGGNLKIADDGSTLLVDLKDFPARLDIEGDFATGVARFDASTPITFAELALMGPDRKLNEPAWTNFLALDRVATIETSAGSLPQFHLRLNHFKSFNAKMANSTIDANVTFSQAPGNLGVRYRGPEGWLESNITTSLPPSFHFTATNGGVNWTTSPNHLVDVHGAASFDGFEGRWNVDDLPADIRVTWTSVGNVFEATLAHNSTSFPLFDFEGTMNFKPKAPAALVKLYLKDIPARIATRADGATGHFGIATTNADGQPATASTLEAAYVANAAEGLPVIAKEYGTVAYARMRTSDMPSEVFARLSGISSIQASTVADPTRGGRQWVRYEGTEGTKVTVDIADHLGTRFVGTVDKMPASVYATIIVDNATGTMYLDITASNTTTWNADWTTKDRVLNLRGNMPKVLHVAVAGGAVVLTASPAMTIQAAYGPPGSSLVPATDDDYLVARLYGEQASFAGKISNLERVDANPNTGSYFFQRSSSDTVYLDVVLAEAGVRGTVTGMPLQLTANVYQNGIFSWTASGATGAADLIGTAGAHLWRLNATGLPRMFQGSVGATVTTLETLVPEYEIGRAFTSLEVGYTAHAATKLPVLDGQGFVLDLRPDVGFNGDQYPNQRLSARIDGLEKLVVWNNERGLYATLDRASASGGLKGKVLTPEQSMEVDLVSLPAYLEVELDDVSGTGTGIHVRVDGGSDSLGQASVKFQNGAVGLDLEAGSLPSDMELWYTPEADGFRLEYEGSASSTTLKGTAITPDGLGARFDLTQLPGHFVVTTSAANQTFDFTAENGALSGELLAGPPGVRVWKAPFEHYGASISLDAQNEHAWFRVAGLTGIHWKQVGVEDTVSVEHSVPSTSQLYVHYEDSKLAGNLSLYSIPTSVQATVNRSELETTISYRASGSSVGARIQAAEKDSKARAANIVLGTLPASFDARMASLPDGFQVNFSRTGSESPHARINLRGADGAYAQGFIIGIPTSLTVLLNTEAAPATDSCVFNLQLSEALGLLQVQMGRGTMKEGTWLRGGSYHLGLDLTDMAAPGLDVNLAKLKGGKFCWTTTAGFTTGFTVEESMSDLRVYYQDKSAYLKVRLVGMVAGAYSVTQSASGLFEYTGAGTLTRLEASGKVPWGAAPFGRETLDVVLAVDNIPGYLGVFTDGSQVVLDSNDAIIHDFALSIRLGGMRPPKSPAGDPAASNPFAGNFYLDTRDFQIKHALIEITDSPDGVTWEGTPDEKHKFVFRNVKDLQLGVEVYDFVGAEFDLRTPSPGALPVLNLQTFQVKKDVGLRVAIEVPGNSITVVVPKMPASWTASFSAGSKNDVFNSHITPSTWLEEATVRVGPTMTNGFNFSIYKVPGDTPVTLKLLAGSAIAQSLTTTNLPFGGYEATYFLDSTHHITITVGWTKNYAGPDWEQVAQLIFEGDLDGSRNPNHPDNPRFFDFRDSNAQRVNIIVQWGDVGVAFDGGDLVLVGTVLIGAYAAGSAAWEYTKNGVVGASEATIGFVINGVKYLPTTLIWRD